MASFMCKVLPLGIVVHIILFVGVMEVYFQSPIQHGLAHFKSVRDPPAKRVVVIIADGLRAESMFLKEYENRTPFLTETRYNRSTWGISHTRVPTESRPGHVSIMAGIYEDPSAIMKGWQQNPVEFDSVINQSTNAWCLGSPDNVYLFNKGNVEHVRVHAYSPQLQDFGKKETALLDKWVFDELQVIFKFRSVQKHCGSLCDDGNIFFLNLLGLDTAGHSYKPNSKEHLDNMRVVDEGVRDLEEFFNDFYADDKTAFIFTADHGMTDWGSHGSGSPFETETPFVAWGAGIRTDKERRDVNQADIAPLIATLIGINYPSNSIGVLPHRYLNMPKVHVAEAMHQNMRQLLELYLVEESKSSTALFYKPYEGLKNMIPFLSELQDNFSKRKYDAIISKSRETIEDILKGLTYLQHYSSRPILICLSLGMLLWVVYLSMSIAEQDPRMPVRYIHRPYRYQLIVEISSLILIFVFCLVFFRSPMAFTHYLYALLPSTVLLMILLDVKYLLFIKKFFLIKNMYVNMLYSIVILLLLEVFVLGFHSRYFFSVSMIIIGLWSFTQDWKCREKFEKIRWFVTCFALALFPMLPVMKTNFSFVNFVFTFFVWICILLCNFKYKPLGKESDIAKTTFQLMLRNQLICYLITVINVLYIAISFELQAAVPITCNIVSWLLAGAALVNLYITPINVIFRSVIICIGLMNLYTLFMFNAEGPFFVCLLYLLYEWIRSEIYMERGSRTCYQLMYGFNFNSSIYNNKRELFSYMDFRRAFFFLGFIFISFFGTGNIASLNSFDPMWVRNFLTVFSPFTMVFLILVKITIPMLAVICAFRALNVFLNIRLGYLISVVILFCDIMLFHFMFLIKNTGSWLEIGTSLSHFIIMELTSVIIMFFYFLSYCVTNFTLFKYYVRYFERRHIEDQHM